MMKSPARGTLYDPRLGLDFQLKIPPNDRFSSAASGFLVLEGERIEWMTIAHVLDSCFAAAGPNTFILYRPWWPGSRHKSEEFTRQFGSAGLDFDGVLLATPARSVCAVEILALREQLGGHKSGVWLFGACSDVDGLVLSLKRTNVFNDDALFIAAECADYIDAALALDEGGRSTLLVRIRESTSQHVDQLVATIAPIIARADE